MTGRPGDVRLLEDARWDSERACVEVTALVSDADGSRQVTCVITLEALESRVSTPSPVDPLRLVRDFEGEIAAAVSRRLSRGAREVAITGRDL